MKTKILVQLINAVKIAVKCLPPILIIEQLMQELKDYGNEKNTDIQAR